jgi:PAS domain S-box-containing protein
VLVSCRATRALIEAVEAASIDPSSLVEGTDVTLAQLRDGRARIGWDDFARVLDNVARLFPSDEALAALGRGLARAPGFAGAWRVGARLVGPREVYGFFFRWFGPSMFGGIKASVAERPDGRLALSLELPPGARSSRPFFAICRGGIAAMPRIIGAAEASVEAALTGARGDYLVTLPASASLLGRARHALRAFRGAEDSLGDLERFRHEAHESYDALTRSRQDFRDLLEKMSDSVVVHRDGEIIWGNHAFVRQLGYERTEQVVGLHVLRDVLHPDDRAPLAATMNLPLLPAGAPPRRFRARRRDGSLVHIEISAPQIVDFDGAPARLIVGRDVTERERDENARRVAERLTSLGLLAAGVAHEINNPLAYVHANLALARRELDAGACNAGSAMREAIAAAIDGTERVRVIVRELRALGRGELQPIEAVDLTELIVGTLALVRQQVERRARLVVEIATIPRVRGERTRLGQVLLNLLLNAVDAIDEGAPDRNRVEVVASFDAATDAGLVVLEVRDSGCGIVAEDLGRIFDPFFTTKPTGQGTGLGLPICHRIVSELGGRISVDSNPGRGTTFRVALRVFDEPRDGARPASTLEASVASPAVGRGRVLVIDDEPRLRSVLAGLLGEHHDVESADGGRAALELLRRDDRFDVILCDLGMAGISGRQLYDTLSVESPALADRMIFMTGGTLDPQTAGPLTRDGRHVLEKPFEPEEMLAAVRTQLEAARATPRR